MMESMPPRKGETMNRGVFVHIPGPHDGGKHKCLLPGRQGQTITKKTVWRCVCGQDWEAKRTSEFPRWKKLRGLDANRGYTSSKPVELLSKPPTGPAPGAIDLTRGARIPMLDLTRLTTDPEASSSPGLDPFLIDEVASALRVSREKEEKIALAMTGIFAAWMNEGVNPQYHRAAQAKLKTEWPTLYEAIVDFIEASKVN